MNYQDHSDQQNQTIEYYNQNADKFIESTVSLDVSSLYLPFLQTIRSGSHILDAGCGSGRDSLYFLQHGYTVTAFDASEEMVKTASKKTGLEVKQARFEDIDYKEEFDAIWACASLLHVPSDSIGNVISRLTRAVKPNGILYMSFKYGEKEEVRNRRLFNDYSENKFQALIERHLNLKPFSIWTTYDVRPDRETQKWLNCLVKRIS